jgi:filamentous hemagglutinin
LRRIGVHDTAEGRALLQAHFDKVVGDPSNVTRSFTDEFGEFEVRESLFAGPGGFLEFESTWQILEDGNRRFITAIPFGGP